MEEGLRWGCVWMSVHSGALLLGAAGVKSKPKSKPDLQNNSNLCNSAPRTLTNANSMHTQERAKLRLRGGIILNDADNNNYNNADADAIRKI